MNYMYCMLALLLYCDGDCNYDLCKSQRKGKDFVTKKWPYLDYSLNKAITILNYFEKHEENIYTGLCNVYHEFKKDEPANELFFTSNVSFSTSLQVAKQFRGDEGLIIGLNMERSLATLQGGFTACDVSWISNFPSEKVIMCKAGSLLRCYKHKMTNK